MLAYFTTYYKHTRGKLVCVIKHIIYLLDTRTTVSLKIEVEIIAPSHLLVIVVMSV